MGVGVCGGGGGGRGEDDGIEEEQQEEEEKEQDEERVENGMANAKSSKTRTKDRQVSQEQKLNIAKKGYKLEAMRKNLHLFQG